MNLYKVNIHCEPFTGIYGESFHVEAGSAKTALDKAYKKFDKRFPDRVRSAIAHSLELVEENWR